MKKVIKINKKTIDVNLKNILFWLIISVKAFFNSITQVAWGVAGLFILNIAMTYLMKDTYSIDIISHTFLKLEMFIIQNVLWFCLVFFIWYLYSDLKEVKNGTG